MNQRTFGCARHGLGNFSWPNGRQELYHLGHQTHQLAFLDIRGQDWGQQTMKHTKPHLADGHPEAIWSFSICAGCQLDEKGV